MCMVGQYSHAQDFPAGPETFDDFALPAACPVPHTMKVHLHEEASSSVSARFFYALQTNMWCLQQWDLSVQFSSGLLGCFWDFPGQQCTGKYPTPDTAISMRKLMASGNHIIYPCRIPHLYPLKAIFLISL